jgi:NAD(P) transhydrogenase subunit alpha
MIVGIPKEILEHEGRVAALPTEVAEYVKMGFTVLVEANAGVAAFRSDDEYKAAGAEIVADVADLFARADIILKVKQPEPNEKLGKHEAELVGEGKMLITFLHPANPSDHGFVRTQSATSPRSRWTVSRARRAPRPWTRSARCRPSPATSRSSWARTACPSSSR